MFIIDLIFLKLLSLLHLTEGSVYLKSAQTRRTTLNPCMKASCIHWTIRIPTPVPLLAATVLPSYANLGMDLDYILPFAGNPKNGWEIDGLDDKSELAHRITYCEFLGLSRTRNQVVILSLDQLKSYLHCLPTMVFLEMMVRTPSPRSPLRRYSNDGPLKVGVNTSVWLVQSLGKSSTWFATFH